jgi:RNA polymerase sigma-32 factor
MKTAATIGSPFKSAERPRTTESTFMRKACGATRLSREEERELLRTWQTSRDRKTGEAIARDNLRHVVAIANKYRRYDVPLDVLISEGNIGLFRAMDKFDLNQETRFSTYASYWIRFYILDSIMRSWSLVGGGSGALKTKIFFRLRRERARAVSIFGEGEEADVATAKSLNVSRKRLARLIRQIEQRDVSLNLPTSQDATKTLQDSLFVDADQEAQLNRRQESFTIGPVLALAMSTLTSRERAIVESRLMVDAEEAQSLTELGKRFGVSRERVRQIEEALKLKLRRFISERVSTDDLLAA